MLFMHLLCRTGEDKCWTHVPEDDVREMSSGTHRSLPDEAAFVDTEELKTVDDWLRQSTLQCRSVAVPDVVH